jgi:hypothetical protein
MPLDETCGNPLLGVVAESNLAGVGIDYQSGRLVPFNLAAITFGVSSTLEGAFAVSSVCKSSSHVVPDPVRGVPLNDAAHVCAFPA